MGAGWLPDGRILTEGALPPGTPKYRSPQALEYLLPGPSVLPTEMSRLPGPWVWRARRAALPAAIVTHLLLAGALVFLDEPAPSVELAPLVAEAWKPPPTETPDAGVSEEALAAVQQALPRVGPFILSLGRPMPRQPFEGQRRPPCERGEKEINGACWVGPIETEKPPCGEKMFDYEGRCYFVSFNGPRQSTSGQP